MFLALGGALLAFVPGAPSFTLPPELALALFVAPVLLDAAYDASLRDLQRQLGAGRRPGRLRGRADDGRGRRRRPRAGAGDAVGARRSRSAPSSRRPMRSPRPRCSASCGRRIAS